MKTFIILVISLYAVVCFAQSTPTVIYAPPTTSTFGSGSTGSSGYTYYNTITPSGQSQTGFVYTQPSSPTTGFQQDMTTGQQSTYVTNGNTTTVFPLNSK
jgi:TRAP-type uncharacterized transport system substrate-binding protein